MSGIIDIVIGVLVLSGTIYLRSSRLTVAIVCFAVGLVYLGAGLAIALHKKKKQKG